MKDIDVPQQARLARRPARWDPDLLESKLHRPWVRPGTVRRSSLIDWLTRDDSRPIVSVVAPAGYGKTTLLAQWAERDTRAVAWVSVDDKDNDPKVLLYYIAQALDAVEPVDEGVFEALASPVSSVSGSVVPRLAAAFWSLARPVVLVLDDVHLLHSRECRSALSVLADHVPGGSQLVLAGRAEPPLRIARLRTQGRLAEIGPGELSLTLTEAACMMREAGLTLEENEVAELHRRTEGWPVGLYLATLYLRQGGSLSDAAVSFRGDDQLVAEYVKSEVLARISQPQSVFLTRTAALERMSGPLCEAVLDTPGAAATLTELARSNLLMVPLDRRGQWYRYHHLFREMLLAELGQREPHLLPVLQRRAAAWYAENDLREEALEYFIAAGDVDEASRLVAALWLPVYWQGRVATLLRWLSWLEDQGGIEAHPIVAVQASLLSAAMGRPAEAERWADVVDRWHHDPARPADPPAEAWSVILRAILCRSGPGQMLADAQEAGRGFAAEGVVTPSPVFYEGVARVLRGDLDGGDACFELATRLAEQTDAHEIRAGALCERALTAMARNQWDQGEDLARRSLAALRRAGPDSSYTAPLVRAAQARVAVHRGDAAAARQELLLAQRTRPLLTYALPHFAVQARIELIRVWIALTDPAGAKTLMREIDEVLSRRPDLGTLVGEAEALRARLSAQHSADAPGVSSLTAAELRILPMLATHMSFPEIGAELFLSPNTIKSEAMSIYRKLGVSSRSQAVTCSRQLGLIELLPGVGRGGLPGQIHEGLAADVDDHAADGAAGERPGALTGIVVGDRLGSGPPHDQAAAPEAELPGLGYDLSLARLLIPDVQAQQALRRHRVALPLEGRRQDHMPGRDALRGLHHLHGLTDEVVHIRQLPVLDVQGVAAEP
jgi:LuxR family transcriptional regulator, maltose regulon positive regulatory protein